MLKFKSLKNSITISQTVCIEATPEAVWDFTQNFNNRTTWDDSIISVEVVSEAAPKKVRIKSKGGLETTLVYKQENRPHKTSLAMKDTKSFFIKGGGGSWKYQKQDAGTLWKQTNTIILKNVFVRFFLGKYIKSILEKETLKSMLKAKQYIEEIN